MKTIVNIILDQSGSMGVVRESTISGLNEYIQSLQKKKGTFLFTLTLFNSYGIEKPYIAVNVKKVKPLTKKTYTPDGNTPLYDACVDTIEAVEREVNAMEEDPAVLVVIMTDGEENSSQKHDQKCLSDLIGKLKKKGNWTFTFMGANQDSWAVAQKFGFSRGNIMNYVASNAGILRSFNDLSASTESYASAMKMNQEKGVSMSLDNFFEKKDGDKNES